MSSSHVERIVLQVFPWLPLRLWKSSFDYIGMWPHEQETFPLSSDAYCRLYRRKNPGLTRYSTEMNLFFFLVVIILTGLAAWEDCTFKRLISGNNELPVEHDDTTNHEREWHGNSLRLLCPVPRMQMQLWIKDVLTSTLAVRFSTTWNHHEHGGHGLLQTSVWHCWCAMLVRWRVED